MDSIGERIQYVIDELFGRNKAAFARAVEISPTTLSSYLSAKKASKPTSDFLASVVRLGVDAKWLLTGIGSMGLSPAQGDNVDTHGPNSPGKIVGNVDYHQEELKKEEVKEVVKVEMHSPEDIHQIELLTQKVALLTEQNQHFQNTINDLRSNIDDLRSYIKELRPAVR